jgi:hypothetical protein
MRKRAAKTDHVATAASAVRRSEARRCLPWCLHREAAAHSALPGAKAPADSSAVSCALFRRHRNLYALGVAQCLLGLCFAACVPDTLNHHLGVGLGYLRYRATPPVR